MPKPLCSVQQVANFFIDKGREENIPITQMKLIKLVYFAYGQVIAITNERLFYEPIEAWEHGAVMPALYHEFKRWGNRPITQNACECNYDTGEVFVWRIARDTNRKDIMDILNSVWNHYKGLSVRELRQKACEDNSPWSRTYKERQSPAVIADDYIRDYFIKELHLEKNISQKSA